MWVSNNDLIEALGRGVTASPYDNYRDVEFHLVHSDLNDVERADADAFVHTSVPNTPHTDSSRS